MSGSAVLPAKVLGYASSPFPVSFDGSGALFGAALFALIVATALSVMSGVAHFRRLWIDRREGNVLATAYRITITAFCSTAILLCAPEVVYMIAYADSSAETLQTMLLVKRALNVFALVPFLIWLSMTYLYGPEIEFAIKYPIGKMWTDHRLHRLKRFASIVGLAAAFATAVTIGRLFS